MVGVINSVAAARCVNQTFTTPSVFGLETVSITASIVNNWTLEIPQGAYISHPARNVTELHFCSVNVATTHAGWDDLINTQVWLPLEGWNSRLQMSGGGGLSTGLSIYAMTGAVSDGYSSVSTDGGHYADDPSTWALTSPGNTNLYKLFDYSTRGLYEAAIIGKLITEDFYGQPVSYSYFNGCSTGGRQGLMFAQRFSDAFDGILANSPGIKWDTGIIELFYPLINLQDFGTFPHQCELTALTKAAVEECDPKDGVKDGMISAPELCNFDPFSLVGKLAPCGGFEVKITYAAALGAHGVWERTEVNGATLWPGMSRGADLSGVLNTTCDKTGVCKGVPFAPPLQWLVYFLKKDPSYDYRSLTVQEMHSLLNSPDTKLYHSFLATDDPNLAAFRNSGGKMLTWHGLDDQYIPIDISRTYYDDVLKLDPNASQYYRYFQVPAVQHCGGGNGPFPGQAFEALVAWVERGVAPDTLNAVSPPNSEGIVYQRPICAYPLRAEYQGYGDIAHQESWECK